MVESLANDDKMPTKKMGFGFSLYCLLNGEVLEWWEKWKLESEVQKFKDNQSVRWILSFIWIFEMEPFHNLLGLYGIHYKQIM